MTARKEPGTEVCTSSPLAGLDGGFDGGSDRRIDLVCDRIRSLPITGAHRNPLSDGTAARLVLGGPGCAAAAVGSRGREDVDTNAVVGPGVGLSHDLSDDLLGDLANDPGDESAASAWRACDPVIDTCGSRKSPAVFDVMMRRVRRVLPAPVGGTAFSSYSSIQAMGEPGGTILFGYDCEFVTLDDRVATPGGPVARGALLAVLSDRPPRRPVPAGDRHPCDRHDAEDLYRGRTGCGDRAGRVARSPACSRGMGCGRGTEGSWRGGR